MAAPRERHPRRALRAELLGDLLGTVTDTTGALVNGVTNTAGAAVNGVTDTVGTAVSGVTNTASNLLTPIVAPIVAPLAPIVNPIISPIISPLVPTTAPSTPATSAPTSAPATAAPPLTSAPKPTTVSPSSPVTAAPSPPSTTKSPTPATTPATKPATTPATEAPESDGSSTEAPTATETPSVTEVTAGSLDMGKTKPFSVTDDSSISSTGDSSHSNSQQAANFATTTSDGTSHKSNYSPLSSSGSSSGSRDKDGNGASSIRTLAGVGMSFGVAATIVVVIALIMYVRRARGKVQSQYKSDTFDPAELDSHRSDLDTAGSSYMTGNLTAMAGIDYLAANSAWNDPELLVVRVPLDSVVRDELISSGAFGEVYRGRFQQEEVAIKTLLPSKRKEINEIKAFQAEIKLMIGLEHPRIVRFVGVAWESLADLCVLTEFMAGGDLTSLLASFEASSPPRARGFDADKIKIALHVAHALMYLHSLQPAVIHRDLKSKNVLLDAEWNAKVTDFGVSREQADETMTSGVGSSLWMAPEVTMGERYDEKADMFSFGVLLSELDTQLLPYSHARFEGESEMIPQTTVLQLVSLGIMTIRLTDTPRHEDMQQLARQCVELDPKDRPTAAEALHRIHVAYSAALEDQSVTL